MKKLKYVGPLERVVVPDRDTGAEYEASPGETVEVPDELAAGLLEQDVWEPAAGGKAAAVKSEPEG